MFNIIIIVPEGVYPVQGNHVQISGQLMGIQLAKPAGLN